MDDAVMAAARSEEAERQHGDDALRAHTDAPRTLPMCATRASQMRAKSLAR